MYNCALRMYLLRNDSHSEDAFQGANLTEGGKISEPRLSKCSGQRRSYHEGGFFLNLSW